MYGPGPLLGGFSIPVSGQRLIMFFGELIMSRIQSQVHSTLIIVSTSLLVNSGKSISLFYAVLCQIVSLQYLSRASLHRLAGLPCRLFLSDGLQVVTCEVHRSYLRRLVCPAHNYFICLTLLIIYVNHNVCPLPDPDVRISILVCDVEHTYFHFRLCGRKFVLC